MAKVVGRASVNIELSQEEINHLTVVLGNTSQGYVREHAETHGLGFNQISDNTLMYNFFLGLSESNSRRNV